MHAPLEKSRENNNRAVANFIDQNNSATKQSSVFVDNRQSAISQRKIKDLMNNGQSVNQHKDIHGMVPKVSGVLQLGKNNKSEKNRKAKEAKKRRDQSRRDRNANKVLKYETTSKKDAKAKQDAARNMKGTMGHASGGKGNKKNNKTQKELNKIRRQMEVDKKMKKWRRREDDNDNGGAGGGIGVLLNG